MEPKTLYAWYFDFTKKERYKAAAYFGYYLYKLRAKYKETNPNFFGEELYYNKKLLQISLRTEVFQSS